MVHPLPFKNYVNLKISKYSVGELQEKMNELDSSGHAWRLEKSASNAELVTNITLNTGTK